MQDLKIAFVQAPIVWTDPQANRMQFDSWISQIRSKPDLIVLPETFNTGFPVDPVRWAEQPDGKSVQWLREKAIQTGAVVIASLLIRTGENYHNSLIWMRPDGSFSRYNKRHVFRMGGEHEKITPGEELILEELNGWKIRPMICYDLRFPVWCRNTFKEDQYEYDLMVFVANWPAVRSYPWKQLLLARAIENQAYVLGVNRVGKDELGIAYSGDSCLVDAKGEKIAEAKSNSTEIVEAVLSCTDLSDFRAKFKAGMDWDSFRLEV